MLQQISPKYSAAVLNIDNNMFLEQQISISEWFLKDHVTLKTDENSALPSQEWKNILQ